MRKNFALKLFSLVIAVLLDFYLHSPNNQWELELDADIELRNLPSSWMVIWPKGIRDGGRIKVRLKGPEPLIEPLKVTPLPVFIDLPDPLPKQHRVHFASSDLNLPPGIEVVDFEPSHAELTFEKVVKRELSVVAKVIGEVKTGYEIASVRVNPQTVSAKGPLTELGKFVSINTGDVDVTDWDKSKHVSVELQEAPGFVSLGLNFVTVEVDIRPKQAKRSFKGVPVDIITAPGQIAVSRVSIANVTVSGDEKAVKEMSISQIKLQLDCSEMETGRHLVPIRVSLDGQDKGMEVSELNPSSISVNVAVENE